MKLAQGKVHHRGAGRVRVRIKERRGDAVFFQAAEKRLAEDGRFGRVETHPFTGSILFLGPHPDVAAIARFAEDHQLFTLDADPEISRPLPARFQALFKSVDGKMRQVTDGQLDLPGSFFMLFIILGLYEVARGNVKPPPWHSAFWYAFGLYSAWLVNYKNGQTTADGKEQGVW